MPTCRFVKSFFTHFASYRENEETEPVSLAACADEPGKISQMGTSGDLAPCPTSFTSPRQWWKIQIQEMCALWELVQKAFSIVLNNWLCAVKFVLAGLQRLNKQEQLKHRLNASIITPFPPVQLFCHSLHCAENVLCSVQITDCLKLQHIDFSVTLKSRKN